MTAGSASSLRILIVEDNPANLLLTRATLQRAGYTTAHFGKWHLGIGAKAPKPDAYGIDDHRTWHGVPGEAGPSLLCTCRGIGLYPPAEPSEESEVRCGPNSEKTASSRRWPDRYT